MALPHHPLQVVGPVRYYPLKAKSALFYLMVYKTGGAVTTKYKLHMPLGWQCVFTIVISTYMRIIVTGLCEVLT